MIRGGNAYGVIEHMVTHSSYRRKGLGKDLLEFTLKYAWDQGCTEVMLLSGIKLEGAHKLYRNLGFDEFHRKGFVKFRPNYLCNV